jgi:nitrogen fixation protein NifQ
MIGARIRRRSPESGKGISIVMSRPAYQDLIRQARFPGDLLTLAFAGVLADSLVAQRRPLIRGLSESRFKRLLNEYFPPFEFSNGADEKGACDESGALDEFHDLVQLLLDSRVMPTEQRAWLSYAIATASMGANHLWQDLGLPNRTLLSQLLNENFPGLAAKNVGDMKWKKFFYRQLCERAEIPICKSPNCAICTDYDVCFAVEDGDAKVSTLPVVPLRAIS